MESVIDLPRAVLTDKGDHLSVRHKKTGAKTTVSKQQLDNWCLSKLREMLSEPAEEHSEAPK